MSGFKCSACGEIFQEIDSGMDGFEKRRAPVCEDCWEALNSPIPLRPWMRSMREAKQSAMHELNLHNNNTRRQSEREPVVLIPEILPRIRREEGAWLTLSVNQIESINRCEMAKVVS